MKGSSTLRDTAVFNNLAHIAGKTDRIFVKILRLNFGSQPESVSDPDQILLGGGLRSLSDFVVLSRPDSPWWRSALSE